jgi:hypothetical protein
MAVYLLNECGHKMSIFGKYLAKYAHFAYVTHPSKR